MPKNSIGERLHGATDGNAAKTTMERRTGFNGYDDRFGRLPIAAAML
jgi:hypothetical protein